MLTTDSGIHAYEIPFDKISIWIQMHKAVSQNGHLKYICDWSRYISLHFNFILYLHPNKNRPFCAVKSYDLCEWLWYSEYILFLYEFKRDDSQFYAWYWASMISVNHDERRSCEPYAYYWPYECMSSVFIRWLYVPNVVTNSSFE